MFRATDTESEISQSEEPEDEEIKNVNYGDYDKDSKSKRSDDKRTGSGQSQKSDDTQRRVILETPSENIRKNRMIIGDDEDELDDQEEEYGEEEEGYISRSMHSAFTEIDSEFELKYPVDSEYKTEQPIITKLVQKYQRDSETDIQKEQLDYQKGIVSHSKTKLRTRPICFCFGARNGCLHQGDEIFSERSRNLQGFANAVSAYAYSFTKPPGCWSEQDVDKVLEIGDQLYLASIEDQHVYDRPLKPKEINDVVILGEYKIQYKVHEAEITGVTKTKDPKIFDLLKGLVLFFGRHRAGILTTPEASLLIMKRKRNYYVFDPRPRDVNLYIDGEGTALLANFYDLQSVMVMLVDRGDITNSPYIISRISLKKVVEKDADIKDDGDSVNMRKESEYQIVNQYKAVIVGTFHIGDKCFVESKKQQVLCVILTSLFYHHVTPSAAWHSKTVDKLLLIGNQLYLECIKEMTTVDFTLHNIPAFFTVGTVTVEIVIYANQSSGFMFKKGVCAFEEMTRKFFKKHSSAILEIDKYWLGLWKQRNFFYLFDPYCRNHEAIKSEEGAACVSMNGTLKTLADTIVHNFDTKDFIFKLHAVKLIKLNKDPCFGSEQPKVVDSELALVEKIRIGNKKAVQQVKAITVDKTEKATRDIVAADISLGPSVLEIASDIDSINNNLFIKKPQSKELKSPQALTQQDMVYDLDSPSLSDTQIVIPCPDHEKQGVDEVNALRDLEGVELEKEMNLAMLLQEENAEDVDLNPTESFPIELKTSSQHISLGIDTSAEIAEGGEEDFDGQRDVQIQKGKDAGLKTVTAEMNTDLLGVCPLPRIVLEPTNMAPVIRAKIRAKMLLSHTIQKIPDVVENKLTQAEELSRKCNFIPLPDGSHILYGSINIADYEPELHEDASPFVSILAVAMERKYTLHTWSTDVVDFVIKCGHELFQQLQIDFAAFYTIEVPQIAIGSTIYHVLAEHLFDSLLEPTILEAALSKILFKKYGMGVIATKIYSCAVYLKNEVYYMFDGYGCNLVGLGEGPANTGVGCLLRFRNLNELIHRFMYNKKQREVVEPTEATRFIISTVKVCSVFPSDQISDIPDNTCRRNILEDRRVYDEEGEEKPAEILRPKNILGYTQKGKYWTIQGSMGVEGRFEETGSIKVCHFICICTVLGLLCKPLKKWSTKRVNYVFETGNNLFPYIDNTSFADKRCIRNLLIDKFFFDVVVKRLTIQNPVNYRNFKVALDFILARKHRYILIQFSSCCFLLYKTKCYYHLFDPYGLHTGNDEENKNTNENKQENEKKTNEDKELQEQENGKACWIKFKSMRQLRDYINKNTISGDDNFFFFTVNVSFLKKASKWRRLEYKLRAEKVKKKHKGKPLKILHESEDWLGVFPVPWSRMSKNVASGTMRDSKASKWNNWDVEYANDLFSLVGTIHQTSKGFSRISRGKQTIANCIVSIVMIQMYDFSIWNTSILNSILRNGDTYFKECIQDISDENYELTIENFKKDLVVHPYNVKIQYQPCLEGTMFVIKPKQFNLSKALRFFFEKQECRHGIICCKRDFSKTKFLSFGRVQFGVYYMFDCQSVGPPMFLDQFTSASYILRCMSLNRLLHVMTLTLQGGDFFIFNVDIIPPGEDSEEETRVTDYETAPSTTEGEETPDVELPDDEQEAK